MPKMRSISHVRFDVRAGRGRAFGVSAFGDEVRWYESDDGAIMATLMLDTDGEYSGILFGRDAVGRFRWIGQTDFFHTPGPAVAATEMFAVAAAADSRLVFEQGDEGKPVDLFTPVVIESKLHPRFVLLSSDERYAAARSVIENLMPWIENQDGNFVQQFQSNGFDARIWELYLYMTLREADLDVFNPKPAPDFLASRPGVKFLVEATTANPPPSGKLSARPAPGESPEAYFDNFLVSRYSGPLLQKLGKRYWESPAATGLPLAIAIQDFHDELSMTFSGNSLQVYLYGKQIKLEEDGTRTVVDVEEHIWGKKVIPSGFFYRNDAEHISAVLFNSAGTMSKFNRIGIGAGFGHRDVDVVFSGRRRDPFDSTGGENFSTHVTEGFEETWVDGLNVFHNPRARHPFDESFIPGAAHHYWDGEQFEIRFPEGHLENSISVSIKRVSKPDE